MNGYGTTAQVYVGEDASIGVMHLFGRNLGFGYDRSYAFQNIIASHFKWARSAVGDGYAEHEPVAVTDTNGRQLDRFRDAATGALGRFVTPGQRIVAEFTIETEGPRTIDRLYANYYISLSPNYDSRDQVISQTFWEEIEAEFPFLSRQTITLPSNLARNRMYYLKVRLDPSNTFHEHSKADNVSYIPLYVP